MRIGVLLPTFDTSARPALEAAERVESAGLDGVFVYDHLWQLGSDHNPSLSPFPLLGALAASTSAVSLGTLVARVGLVADELLIAEFSTLAELSGGRVIAGIGTGDRKSLPEHLALGIPHPPADHRRASLERCAAATVARGIPTWIGGGSPQTNAVAQRLATPINLWSASPAKVAEAARFGPVTWGGVLSGDEVEAAAHLRLLAAAGAAWAVLTWKRGYPERLAAVAAAAGVREGGTGR